eukprot:g4592.t1
MGWADHLGARWSALFEESERAVFCGGLLATYFVFFWGHHLLLSIVSRLGWFERHRIQQGKAPSAALVREALLATLVGHAVTVPLAAYYGYDFFARRGMRFGVGPGEWPSAAEAASVLFVWHVLFDTWFYWAHRLMHTPALYARIHKQHHRFLTPVGIAATYAHPVEDLIVNLGSTFCGPALVFPRAHFVLLMAYMALRFNETIDAHCGYDFPWSVWQYTGRGTAAFHDWHHSNQAGNFGGWPFWDKVCGTDRASVEARAHAKAKKGA